MNVLVLREIMMKNKNIFEIINSFFIVGRELFRPSSYSDLPSYLLITEGPIG